MEIIKEFPKEKKKRVSKKKRKSITTSVSFREDVYAILYDYCNKYFQGNMSSCIGYIGKRYIEYEDKIEKSLSILGSVDVQSAERNIEPNIEDKKEVLPAKIHLDNLNLFDLEIGVDDR